MSDRLTYKGYAAAVEFDADAGVLHGEVIGLRDVVTFEAAEVAALVPAFRGAVDDYLALCAERGEVPDKPYSGRVLLRIDPRLHRRLVVEAARAGQSLNTYVESILANGRTTIIYQPALPQTTASGRPTDRSGP